MKGGTRNGIFGPPPGRMNGLHAIATYYDRLDGIEARFERVMDRRWLKAKTELERANLNFGYCKARLQSDLERMR